MTSLILAAILSSSAPLQRQPLPALTLETDGTRIRRVTHSAILMSDPSAVEVMLKNPGRGQKPRYEMLLPKHLHAAALKAASTAGLGRPTQAPQNPDQALSMSSIFRGKELIVPPIKTTLNEEFPETDVWDGTEGKMFHGVSFKGGTVTVRTSGFGGIRAAQICSVRPELGPNGELINQNQTTISGMGPGSVPVKPGQAYYVILEMDAKTPGDKSGTIQINDGTEIVINAKGKVTAPVPQLTGSFMNSGGGNQFVAGKSYARTLTLKSNLVGQNISIQKPMVPGVSIAGPSQITVPSNGIAKATYTFNPSSTMSDLPVTASQFVISIGDYKKGVPFIFSVSTYWIESEPFFQKAGDARIWASLKINSSGYCIYDTRLWTEALVLTDNSYYGFYLKPPIDNQGTQLGFYGGQVLNGFFNNKFYYNVYEGTDPELAKHFDKIDGFGIAFHVNNTSAFNAWKAKVKLKQLNLKSVD